MIQTDVLGSQLQDYIHQDDIDCLMETFDNFRNQNQLIMKDRLSLTIRMKTMLQKDLGKYSPVVSYKVRDPYAVMTP